MGRGSTLANLVLVCEDGLLSVVALSSGLTVALNFNSNELLSLSLGRARCKKHSLIANHVAYIRENVSRIEGKNKIECFTGDLQVHAAVSQPIY